jgi:hypothetical protein
MLRLEAKLFADAGTKQGLPPSKFCTPLIAFQQHRPYEQATWSRLQKAGPKAPLACAHRDDRGYFIAASYLSAT